MLTKAAIEKVIAAIGFQKQLGSNNTWLKVYSQYSNYSIFVLLDKDNTADCKIQWGDKISVGRKTTSSFKQDETLVVLECVNRLLEKGYRPESLTLEKDWQLGHTGKGYLDILVYDQETPPKPYLMIECKTFGPEHNKEKNKMLAHGGQLFSYFVQERQTKYLCLYSSMLADHSITYTSDIIEVTPEFNQPNQRAVFEAWNKSFSRNGIFEDEITPYKVTLGRLRKKNLEPLKEENSNDLFNKFLEILRHNVVSDKPNAFNKIFNLFLCKIVDEDDTSDDNELSFQWYPGDRNEEVLTRLNDLYKRGMKKYLDKEIADYSEEEINQRLGEVGASERQELNQMMTTLRLYKNQEFAFKEVFNKDSFDDNCFVVREVVKLIEPYKIKYTEKQQFLGDFFEQLLKESIKQESGQFFTPLPITRFICESIPLAQIIDRKIADKDPDFLPYIIDYASGSGHFLTEAMDSVSKIIQGVPDTDPRLTQRMREKISSYKATLNSWAVDFMYGIEKDYRLAKTTKVSCFLNGDGEAKVFIADGLDNFYTSKSYRNKLKSSNEADKDNQQFDVLLSNPPYSVRAFRRTLVNADKSFDLYERLTDQSSEIECLFVERAKQLLKVGGYAGILLPASLLANGGIYEAAREILLKYFEIKAIVKLGGGTFMATGTNTLAIFLKRRPNTTWQSVQSRIERFFTTPTDATINGVETAITTYVESVWKTLSFTDYISLIGHNPNGDVRHHPLYIDYWRYFDSLGEIINLKKKKAFLAKTPQEQEKDLSDRFYTMLDRLEKERILYFLLAYNQTVVLVDSGEKEVEKAFLGYDFSNRRGDEGIHVKRDKEGHIISRLYNPTNQTDPTRVNSYILQNYLGNPLPEVDASLQSHLQVRPLVTLMNFGRVAFDKIISPNLVRTSHNSTSAKWPLQRLGELAQIFNGATPDTDNPAYWGGSIHWATLVDTKQKYMYSTARTITEEGVLNSNVTLLPINTVIFSSRATIGETTIAKVKTCTNQGFKSFVCNPDKLSYEYLYYVLKREVPNIKNLCSGMTYPEINITQFSQYKIPLPPLTVQEEMVSQLTILETQSDDVVEETRRINTEIEEYVSGLFAIIDKKRLGGVVSFEYGWSLPESKRIPGEYPVVGSNGIVGFHNTYMVDAPAIIVGRKGSAGKVTLVEKPCTPIDTTFWLKFDPSVLHYKYVYYIIKALKLESLAGGLGPGGLNRNDAYERLIPVLTLTKQTEFVTYIESLEKTLKDAANKLVAINQEKAQIVEDALY